MTTPAVCCFCALPVQWHERVDIVVYPLPGADESQALVAHRTCLVDRLDPAVPLHPDLSAE